jgi:hypothetical protein
VAAFPLKIQGGDPTRVEHVDHARKSVTHAVKSIKAEEKGETIEEYDYLPYFYSRVFKVRFLFQRLIIWNLFYVSPRFRLYEGCSILDAQLLNDARASWWRRGA